MQNSEPEMLNEPVDVSADFHRFENPLFHASRLAEFDAATGDGVLEWTCRARKPRLAFNQVVEPFEDSKPWEFPPGYDYSKYPMCVSFVSPRTIRLRINAHSRAWEKRSSPMLSGPVPNDSSWKSSNTPEAATYTSAFGSVTIIRNPWHIEIRDASGRLLTRTQHFSDTFSLLNTKPMAFCFARSVSDMRRGIAASFSLSPDEMIFGGGESFTRLNKRGQKLVLWPTDAHGVQTSAMYKPIPFFLSNRGYGMFAHTSAPVTFDFGADYDQANVIYVGEDELDLFIFLGTPAEILTEYTGLTGRSPLPPLWSFGLWMSRITYKAEDEVRDVAAKLREHRVPCDVIHLDTGWFETEWLCDYRFSTTRFKDPAKMIADLRRQGLRVSLWQLPYFLPGNALYAQIVAMGLFVPGPDGHLPTEDAILDFSNPQTVRWYQDLLAKLFKMGVAAIKVDFGEAAPLHGLYASGRTGWFEHNLYPLRYNQAAAEVTEKETGESIIFARSAWAGSQRYPIHWGGDAENTNTAMAASLRGGLSLGLCGFSFWSHDIGGFVKKSPRDLYRRWMPFGMLTSHSRCHGSAPKEPWAYDAAFLDDFRRATELKYRLMPYIYAQARIASEHGHPMLRPLFFDFPTDPGSWLIENQFLLGSDLLAAPLFEETTGRSVYVPPGDWIDYQIGKVYSGPGWKRIEAGTVPVILLVRSGAVLPHVPLAQSTTDIDWNQIEFIPYTSSGANTAEGFVFRPGDRTVTKVFLRLTTGAWQAADNAKLPGKIRAPEFLGA